MKRIIAVLPLLALAAACADASSPLAWTAAAPLLANAPADPGQYIVVLREGANPRSVAALMGITPRRVYTAALNGFAATLNPGQLNALRHNPDVEYVEADGRVQLATTVSPVSWNQDRIDQRDLPLSNSYTYGSNGKGVIVYVLDTGIRMTHRQFRGRAKFIPNGANGDFVGDGHGSAEDCHGHGTRVAAIAGGETHGVAKAVYLYAGRVTNCNGGGNASTAIAAMDWITANGADGVVNMSLTYGDMTTVRQAAGRMIGAGHVVVAAAGNGDYQQTPEDACLQSPAGNLKVMTVGATHSDDREGSFSNYGTCVDVLAPGVLVPTAGAANDTAAVLANGTSMATPHVAGVAAQYLNLYPGAGVQAVTDYIILSATPGRVQRHARSVLGGTPNRLLYTGL
jgi:subtilisin family serine protease